MHLYNLFYIFTCIWILKQCEFPRAKLVYYWRVTQNNIIVYLKCQIEGQFHPCSFVPRNPLNFETLAIALPLQHALKSEWNQQFFCFYSKIFLVCVSFLHSNISIQIMVLLKIKRSCNWIWTMEGLNILFSINLTLFKKTKPYHHPNS